MDSYATTDQLTTWLGAAAPADADALLRSATIRVARACNRSPYDTPTGSDAQPLADATCAQSASWVALGIDPAELGVGDGPVTTARLGTGTITRDTTAQAQAVQAAIEGLVPEASAILLAAGLLWQPVALGADSDDRLPDWGTGPAWSPWADPLSGELQWPEPSRWPYE